MVFHYFPISEYLSTHHIRTEHDPEGCGLPRGYGHRADPPCTICFTVEYPSYMARFSEWFHVVIWSGYLTQPAFFLIADLWEIREWSRLLFCNLIVCLKKYLVDPWCSCDDESTPTTCLESAKSASSAKKKTSKNMSILWLLDLTTENEPQRSLEVSILGHRIFEPVLGFFTRGYYQFSIPGWLIYHHGHHGAIPAIPKFQLNSQRLTWF